ncbi:hypothetical protein GCM10011391_28330 [Pullulanibacillus camelliae]|uniref:YopX protein domain-containing protein n=1 Tax=Pullulanibacillus camelliae TaxID=1707096 RepID=A0A8J3DXA8_9BACL|nr:YopX family protein [Pullulanibacillus camelliae]GGE47886.1 hypothetical protein GCM10011391_28330 [Pullulanibacillus camelliae]
MREIKFRAWVKNRRRMYEVLHLHLKTIMNGGIWATVKGYDIIDQKDIHLQIQPGDIEVMQYTGLKDKNGKEIYEGDVLEAEHKLKTQKFKRKYQVIFNEKGYWDAISLDDKPVRLCYAGFDKCEVIGNIYEDPELVGDSN